jgi:hypothetical protein
VTHQHFGNLCQRVDALVSEDRVQVGNAVLPAKRVDRQVDERVIEVDRRGSDDEPSTRLPGNQSFRDSGIGNPVDDKEQPRIFGKIQYLARWMRSRDNVGVKTSRSAGDKFV